MKYARPEMNVLGEAAAVIQDLTKSEMVGQDFIDVADPRQSNPAYDLDE